MENLKIYWDEPLIRGLRKTAEIYIESNDPSVPSVWPSSRPVAIVYMGFNEDGYLVKEQKEPLMKMAALFAAAPQLLDALEKLRCMEAFITDGDMRMLFHETVYQAIEKAKDNSYTLK